MASFAKGKEIERVEIGIGELNFVGGRVYVEKRVLGNCRRKKALNNTTQLRSQKPER